MLNLLTAGVATWKTFPSFDDNLRISGADRSNPVKLGDAIGKTAVIEIRPRAANHQFYTVSDEAVQED